MGKMGYMRGWDTLPAPSIRKVHFDSWLFIDTSSLALLQLVIHRPHTHREIDAFFTTIKHVYHHHLQYRHYRSRKGPSPEVLKRPPQRQVNSRLQYARFVTLFTKTRIYTCV